MSGLLDSPVAGGAPLRGLPRSAASASRRARWAGSTTNQDSQITTSTMGQPSATFARPSATVMPASHRGVITATRTRNDTTQIQLARQYAASITGSVRQAEERVRAPTVRPRKGRLTQIEMAHASAAPALARRLGRK